MTEGVTERHCNTPICLFLIGDDPIFQLGLRAGLEQDQTLEVMGGAPNSDELWSILAATGSPNIFVLDLDSVVSPSASIILCRQLKRQYPSQPILGLASPMESVVLHQLRQTGLDGCWPKRTDIQQLQRILKDLMAGAIAWSAPETLVLSTDNIATLPQAHSLWMRLQLHFRETSLQQLQSRRQTVAQWLTSEQISGWEWVVLSGQLREINAAQSLVEQLFPVIAAPPTLPNAVVSPAVNSTALLNRVLSQHQSLPIRSLPEAFAPDETFQTIKSVVLDQLMAKVTMSLSNQTGAPLEVDILRADKRQELFLIVLKQFEDLLDELRFSDLPRSQLREKRSPMLRDLWQNALTDFLGKYRTIRSAGSEGPAESIEVVQHILQDEWIVEAAILNRIPLFVELVDHLLFHTDLVMDQQVYPVGSLEAILQTEALLGNGVIQVANAVVQPLVNRFSAEASIRRDFFDRRWGSTREIERFRNALSWKYRVQQWLIDPKDIFESQHRLVVFGETGLKYRPISAPRDQELRQLSGVPFVITLVLEARDAIAPPIQATVTFLSQGLVYLLTQVIGRSIGLIGRGVLQGVGYVRSEVRSRPQDQQQP